MIRQLVFGLSLTAVGALAAAAPARGPDSDMAEFRAAYETSQKLVAEGQITDALVHAERAVEIGERVFGADSENVAKLTLNYGRLLLDAEQPVESSRVVKQALKRYEKAYGKDAFELIDPLMILAHASVRPGRRQLLRNYRRAMAIAEKQGDAVLLADLNYDAGIHVLGYGKSMEGLPFIDRSVEIYQAELGPSAHKTGLAHLWLAGFYFGNLDYELAITHSGSALAGFEDAPELHATATDLLTQACRRQLTANPEADALSVCK